MVEHDGPFRPAADGPGPRGLLVALVGAVVGFAVGALLYVGLAPVLERSDAPVRDLQGLLWNAVPFLTALGAVAGWRLAGQRR